MHRFARLWLAAIRGDEQWASVQERCGSTRTKTECGPLRALAPPSQSGSTRCEHFDRLSLWGANLLAYQDRGDFSQVNPQHVWDAAAEYELRHPPPELPARLQPLRDQSFADQTKFEEAVGEAVGAEQAEHVSAIVRAADHGRREYRERFGWVESFRADLREVYVPLVRLGLLAEEQVKAERLHCESAQRWRAAVSDDWLRHPRAQRFTVELLGYLQAEGGDRRPEEALLGTSDVLESLFGTKPS